MKLRVFLLTAMICTLCVGQASALEYTMDAPEDHLFGRPTSDDTIYEWEDPNVDRSKNTALIPPGFGSPTSYLPGSGTALTPNLVPGALEGGGLVSQTGSITYPTVDSGGNWSGPSFTAVTSDLYYSGGYLGTLKIPAIGLSVRVYEGTDSGTLAKGAGHFPGTSIWDGNVCVAGHNRGVRDDFGDLHTLKPGDTVTWTTKLGTMPYRSCFGGKGARDRHQRHHIHQRQPTHPLYLCQKPAGLPLVCHRCGQVMLSADFARLSTKTVVWFGV